MKKEFLLYAVVSALALAVDLVILYLATARFAMAGYLAAALAYGIGLAAHYVLSVRYVFRYRRMASQRRTEVMVYVLTGLVGILLGAGIVHAAPAMRHQGGWGGGGWGSGGWGSGGYHHRPNHYRPNHHRRGW